MRRKTPLKAKTPLTRTTRVKPRNAKRKATELARAYGPEARRVWVKGLPCVACGGRPCDNAHVTTGGMGRKADWTTLVPVCPAHHRMIHDCGQERVARMVGRDWAREAARVQAAWKAQQ